MIAFTIELRKLQHRPKNVIDLHKLLDQITEKLQKQERNVLIQQGHTINELTLSFTTSRGKTKYITFDHSKKLTTISHYDDDATNFFSDTVEDIIYQLYLKTNPTSYLVSCAADFCKHKEFESKLKRLFDQGIRQKDSVEAGKSPKRKKKQNFIQVTTKPAKEDEEKIKVALEKTTSQETDPKPKSDFNWTKIIPKTVQKILNFGKQKNTNKA